MEPLRDSDHDGDFDHNGSTPVDPEVRRSFLWALDEATGNASAAHPAGRRAREAIDAAREQVARGLGARPEEVWFTSGGTEANNWALLASARAAARRAGGRPGHLVVSAIEHKSVLRTAEHLEREGCALTVVRPERDGAVRADAVVDALRPDTFLVALMLANNETGVLQPVAEVARACRARGVRLHTDAVAAAGKLALDVRRLGADLLSVSAHKLYAPKGVGVLCARADAGAPPLEPLIHGCGQQQGLRGGTENTAGCVALGRAFERMAEGAFRAAEVERLRDALWAGISARFPRAQRNGGGELLPNTLSVAFPGRQGAELQAQLGELGISVAAGAAATNGATSHVLLAMGLGEERARSTLRFSLGAGTREASIVRLLGALEQVLARGPGQEVSA